MGIFGNGLADSMPSAEAMSAMPWDDLYRLRLKHAGNPQMQAMIAPFEHQAWAREQGQENPLMGAAIGAVLNPGYQLAKLTGIDKLLIGRDPMTTPASMAELLGGLRGGVQGIGNWLTRRFSQ